jgi:hypothetical protein
MYAQIQMYVGLAWMDIILQAQIPVKNVIQTEQLELHHWQLLARLEIIQLKTYSLHLDLEFDHLHIIQQHHKRVSYAIVIEVHVLQVIMILAILARIQ